MENACSVEEVKRQMGSLFKKYRHDYLKNAADVAIAI